MINVWYRNNCCWSFANIIPAFEGNDKGMTPFAIEAIFLGVPAERLLTYLLTYSKEQSPSWEVNWFSASQEIPRILWKPKVHYRIHKCHIPVPILSHLEPVNTPHPTSWRSILILSLSSHLCLGRPKWSLKFRFPHQNPVYASLLPIHATCPAYLILFDFITRTVLGEEYESLSSSL